VAQLSRGLKVCPAIFNRVIHRFRGKAREVLMRQAVTAGWVDRQDAVENFGYTPPTDFQGAI